MTAQVHRLTQPLRVEIPLGFRKGITPDTGRMSRIARMRPRARHLLTAVAFRTWNLDHAPTTSP
jgi:hypothetical protein